MSVIYRNRMYVYKNYIQKISKTKIKMLITYYKQFLINSKSKPITYLSDDPVLDRHNLIYVK